MTANRPVVDAVMLTLETIIEDITMKGTQEHGLMMDIRTSSSSIKYHSEAFSLPAAR